MARRDRAHALAPRRDAARACSSGRPGHAGRTRPPLRSGDVLPAHGGRALLAGRGGAGRCGCRPAPGPSPRPSSRAWLVAPAIAQLAQPAAGGRRAPRAALRRGRARAPPHRAAHVGLLRALRDARTTHSLPPDNFQEDPQPVVAQRTSPTNIGLYLLSIVAARDFGWLGTLDAVERARGDAATVKELEHIGAISTTGTTPRTAAPLEPRYVSSVDSGNLAGALLDARQRVPGDARTAVRAPRRPVGHRRRGAASCAEAARAAPGASATRAERAHAASTRRSTSSWPCSPRDRDGPSSGRARLAELETAARTVANCARDAAARSPRDRARARRRAGGGAARARSRRTPATSTRSCPGRGSRIDEAVAVHVAWQTLARRSAELPGRCEAALRGLAARRSRTGRRLGGARASRLRSVDALAAALERSAAAAAALPQRLARLAADGARAGHGDGLRLPLRPGPDALLHRVPDERRPASTRAATTCSPPRRGC